MKILKPPVLTEQQVMELFGGIPRKDIQMRWVLSIAKFQRDDTYQKMLDAFEPLIEEAQRQGLFDATQALLKNPKHPHHKEAIKQAKGEIFEEIEKVENPYSFMNTDFKFRFNAFEEARQKILKVLQEGNEREDSKDSNENTSHG